MKHISVFYSDAMAAQNQSFSPSAAKPRLAVQDWLAHHLPINVVQPEPVTVAQLSLAHNQQFVEAVLGLQQANGFGNKSEDVARSLPYTTGAFLSAARAAITEGVTCASVSGFHHAGYNFGGGFCTFNGLMVAALQLKEEKLVRNVGILDLDMHYGNGTQDIIDTKNASSWIKHWSKSVRPSQAESLLDSLPKLIEDTFAGVDLLMYQAGADSHVDDPLGGYLTTEQMRRRDRIVFTECKKLGIPVVWDLAGGYQQASDGSIDAVLELHRATMQECVAVMRS